MAIFISEPTVNGRTLIATLIEEAPSDAAIVNINTNSLRGVDLNTSKAKNEKRNTRHKDAMSGTKPKRNGYRCC